MTWCSAGLLLESLEEANALVEITAATSTIPPIPQYQAFISLISQCCSDSSLILRLFQHIITAMKTGRLYGSDDFNPVYILTQIALLVAVWYSSQSIILVLFNNLFGLPTHLAQLFSPAALDMQDSYSFVCLLTVLVSAGVLTLGLVLVVERANKCLDFASTVYFVHLVAVWLYDGFPTLMYWWAVNAALMVVVVLVSEFLCMKIEQQQISLTVK